MKRDTIRTWHPGQETRARQDFKALSARAQAQKRQSLADDLDDISADLAKIKGRALRSAETALSGAGASSGERVQTERSTVPREVSASLAVATIARSLRALLDELRSS